MPSILFVCSANQCRSPMAQVLFEAFLAEKGAREEWRVESAGVWAYGGVPATNHARKVVRERNLSLEDHKSKTTSADLVIQFDLLIVMEQAHRSELRALYPGITNRIFLLRELAGGNGDFQDPIGGDLEAYRGTSADLESLLRKAYPRIVELTTS